MAPRAEIECTHGHFGVRAGPNLVILLTVKAIRLSFIFGLLATALTSARADEIDDLCRKSMEEGHVPGLAFAAIKNGEIVDHRTYGMANLETQTPVGKETVFRIASISKQFTATAIMMLVQDGRLDLDAGVTSVLPEAPAAWLGITIRQMLGHVSGIPEPRGFRYEGMYTAETYLKLFEGVPVAEKPGSTYRYNNHAYATLSLVVAKVSGKPYRDFIRERIFSPLGMEASYFFSLGDVIRHRADGYGWANGQPTNKLMLRPQVFDGSGGILTTIGDYAKWDRAMRRATLLPESVLKQMWTSGKTTDGKETGYGFGWAINGTEAVSHNGGTFGFTSRVKRWLNDGWTIVIFQNGEGAEGGVNRLEAALSAHYRKAS